MPLLNDENYPEVVRFLRMIGFEERDDNGRRVLPNIVTLFETHFEKSEESYSYVVCVITRNILFLSTSLGYPTAVGNVDSLLSKSFDDGIHQ